MRKALACSLICVGILFAAASTAPPEETDASTSRRDGGSNTGNDSGNTGNDAATTGNFNPQDYGKPCTGDAECPGGVCMSIFSSGDYKGCFKACGGNEDCSDFPYDVANVQCAQLGDSPAACIHIAPQNGPCGGAIFNSVCEDPAYFVCASDSQGAGICVRPCKPSDPQSTSACTVVTSLCGCQAGEGCSLDVTLAASATEPDPDGICGAASALNDPCGYDENSLVFDVCTGGLSCTPTDPNSPSGTCQTPATDGGVGTDA